MFFNETTDPNALVILTVTLLELIFELTIICALLEDGFGYTSEIEVNKFEFSLTVSKVGLNLNVNVIASFGLLIL